MKLEFTTTACVRPELLDQTYSTLNDALVDVDLKTEGTLYINIDPVGINVSEQAIKEEVDVAKSHFKNVRYHIGEAGGSFSKAASWVLSQPVGEFFFNIEDDWCFTKGNFSIQECINIIKQDPRPNILQCVIGKRAISNRVYFPPSLFQTSILQSILNEYPIPSNENPERWLWELKTPKGLVAYNVACSSPGVKYINSGNLWKRENGFEKIKRNKVNAQGKPQGNYIQYRKINDDKPPT